MFVGNVVYAGTRFDTMDKLKRMIIITIAVLVGLLILAVAWAWHKMGANDL